MRVRIVIAGLVLALGFALVSVLVPGSREGALPQKRDTNFTPAPPPTAPPTLQADLDAAAVMARVRPYLQAGAIDQAIALAEVAVAKDPDSLEVRKFLGTLYQQALRPGDYLRNLEALARLQPSLENLTELANLYNALADHGKRVDVLGRLVAAFPDQHKPAMELAYLLASRGDGRAAAALLMDVERRQPGKGLDIAARQTLTSLLLDQGRSEEALALSRSWLGPDPLSGELVDTASLFVRRRRPDLGALLLQPFRERLGKAPELAVMLADLEIGAGQEDEARKALRDRLARGPVPEDAVADFVERALFLGLASDALDAARHVDPAVFSDAQLLQLVEAAHRIQDAAFIDALLERTGDQFLSGRPALGLELAMARKDAAAMARWVARVGGDRTLPPGDRLALVGQLLRLNRKDLAGQILAALDPAMAIGEEHMDRLAADYEALGRAEEGYQFFSVRRRDHASEATERAWVWLALRTARLEAVEAWLTTHRSPDSALLTEIYAAAVAARMGGLALAAAGSLYQRDPGPQNRLLYANALMLSGQSDEALPILRQLVAAPGTLTGVEPLYLAALEASGRGDERNQYLAARLNQGAVPELAQTPPPPAQAEVQAQAQPVASVPASVPAERTAGKGNQSVLRALAARVVHGVQTYADMAIRAEASAEWIPFLVSQLAQIAPEQAVEPVLRLAGKDPERWLPPGLALLTRLGRDADLKRVLARFATDPRLSDARRMAVAQGALEHLEKATAIAALLPLAERDGVASPALRQLLFLWGPRPGAAALDWLEARARHSDDDARQAQWLGLLNQLGAPARTVEILAGRTAGPLLVPAREAHALLQHKAMPTTPSRARPSDAEPVKQANLPYRQGSAEQAMALLRAQQRQNPRDAALRADLVALYVDRNQLRNAARLLALD